MLACAPSNLAVDNIFERLLGFGERVVRLGHPARVLPELREHTLDLLVERHRDVRLARKLVKQALALFREADRQHAGGAEAGRSGGSFATTPGRSWPTPGGWNCRRSRASSIRPACSAPRPPASTARLLGPRRFDLAVIDEACQSTEPGCWIPLLRCDRLVLAGDHCQLPPTVVSQEAAAEGFGVSLFERLMDALRPGRSPGG